MFKKSNMNSIKLLEEEIVPPLSHPVVEELSGWQKSCAQWWLWWPKWVIDPNAILFLLEPSDPRLDNFLTYADIQDSVIYLWLISRCASEDELNHHPWLPCVVRFPELFFHLPLDVPTWKWAWILDQSVPTLEPWYIPRSVLDECLHREDWTMMNKFFSYMMESHQPVSYAVYIRWIQMISTSPKLLHEYMSQTECETESVYVQWMHDLYTMHLNLMALNKLDSVSILSYYIFHHDD